MCYLLTAQITNWILSQRFKYFIVFKLYLNGTTWHVFYLSNYPQRFLIFPLIYISVKYLLTSFFLILLLGFWCVCSTSSGSTRRMFMRIWEHLLDVRHSSGQTPSLLSYKFFNLITCFNSLLWTSLKIISPL